MLSDSPTNLRNFEAVGEPVVKHLSLSSGNNLRYPGKAAKGCRVEDAISITLRLSSLISPTWTVPGDDSSVAEILAFAGQLDREACGHAL